MTLKEKLSAALAEINAHVTEDAGRLTVIETCFYFDETGEHIVRVDDIQCSRHLLNALHSFAQAVQSVETFTGSLQSTAVEAQNMLRKHGYLLDDVTRARYEQLAKKWGVPNDAV